MKREFKTAVEPVVRALRQFRDRIPGLRIATQAVRNYIAHQSANHAGSIAFSTVLAMFPLLLFASAAAGFIDRRGTAAALAGRIIEYVPPAVANALEPAIAEVLDQPSRTMLTIGAILTLWPASSGIQAIRTALNKAYGVQRSLSFWRARLKVMAFTLVVTVVAILLFSSVVILPRVWDFLSTTVGVDPETVWLRTGIRYSLAFLVLLALYTALYGWLPDIRQRVLTVLPGAIVGALLWLGAAAILSYTLRSAGKLAVVYGGFAGMVATLVFLYASAVTVIYGAEINAVIRGDVTSGDDNAAKR